VTAVPKKSPVERDLLASVVKPVVEDAGGRQRVVQLTGAANSTVGRWLEGDIGFDGLIRLASATRTNITLTFPAHGKPTGDAKESPPAWAEGLTDLILKEVRVNRAVVSAALAGADPDRVKQILARIEAELGPRGPQPDEDPAPPPQATVQPPGGASRS
jgi:hypothetical protein